MTLKLCGFAASNYYNQVKLQLLEKQVPFEEELVLTGTGAPALVERSPMAKVPFLDTGHGCISESIACAEYIEASYPQSPMLPADPLAAARVRELVLYIELHLELPARELYPQAYFGGKVSDETQERARRLLVRGVAGLARIARFPPSWRVSSSRWRTARPSCICRSSLARRSWFSVKTCWQRCLSRTTCAPWASGRQYARSTRTARQTPSACWRPSEPGDPPARPAVRQGVSALNGLRCSSSPT